MRLPGQATVLSYCMRFLELSFLRFSIYTLPNFFAHLNLPAVQLEHGNVEFLSYFLPNLLQIRAFRWCYGMRTGSRILFFRHIPRSTLVSSDGLRYESTSARRFLSLSTCVEIPGELNRWFISFQDYTGLVCHLLLGKESGK